MNPPGGGVYQWCGLDKLSKWTMCQVSCDWCRAGHVTTIPSLIGQVLGRELGLDTAHLTEVTGAGGTARPRDVELDR